MSRESTVHLFAALESGSRSPAIHFEGHVLSWAELDERARSYAQALQQAGVARGDRVAVIAETCLEVVIALFGNYYLGAVHVPINTRYLAGEIAHILADASPSAVIGDSDHAARIDEALELAELDAPPVRVGIGEGTPGFRFAELLEATPGDYLRPRDEDLALIIYTSGTTGPSKGATLTHAAVIANTRALTGLWACSPRDRLLLALPLFHVHGLCVGLHGAVIQQMTILLERRFTPDLVVERFGPGEANAASVFFGVPTMYAALVERLAGDFDACGRLARGRLFACGSAPLSAALWDRFVELTDQRILERYGMTETLITLSNPYVGVRRPGSVGQPVPGCDAAIVDDEGHELASGETGELIVHSNGIMRGYWHDPRSSGLSFVIDREGERWFRTGDVGYEDEHGYFHIVGRMSVDIVKSGGFKIATRELEEALASHPAVREVAVVGLPDETWGEAIVACVVPSEAAPSDPDTLLAELIAHHQARLADYKKPRALLVCEQLPRNALGKLQKHLLLERLRSEGPSARR
ncbi:class I adenylate-forming enzyme family protein [Nannocystaceae bacterium ST9]